MQGETSKEECPLPLHTSQALGVSWASHSTLG